MRRLFLMLSAVLLLSGSALAQGWWSGPDMRVEQTPSISAGQTIISQPMLSTMPSSLTISSGSIMQSGSKYSSQITGVGQETPTIYGEVMTIRRGAPPGDDDDDYDPDNPQFGSLGDELLPLILMAVLAFLIIVCRTSRRKYMLTEDESEK